VATALLAIVALVLALTAAPGHSSPQQEGTEAPATEAPATTATSVGGGGEQPEAPTTGTDPSTPSTTEGTVDDTTTTTVTVTATTAPGHGHEEPGEEPDEEMPGHEGPPPSEDFPDDWTPEQVAYAEALIADTEAALPQYANPALLPLLGFVWIFDGLEPGQYQHWIHVGRIVDPTVLSAQVPESLVFRNTGDGPVLEAAMYMLPLQYNLTNIPADLAWLPGWHVHDNLCFEGNFRLVGVTDESGQCQRGFLLVTPPMIHVWAVDTPCGRFAGVDEHGLQCDDHEH
jgi:hypothetical protein